MMYKVELQNCDKIWRWLFHVGNLIVKLYAGDDCEVCPGGT